MNDLFLDMILEEASKSVDKLVNRGMKIDEALKKVSSDYILNDKEEKALYRKKQPTKKIDKSEEVVETNDEMLKPVTTSNQLIFENEEDIDTAIGVLMYKSIPWLSRDDHTITFNNHDELTSAQDALKRRWTFVDSEPRKVAMIEFDNLEDYQTVLNFMASKSMTIIPGDNVELDSDITTEQAEAEIKFKTDSKLAKENGLELPEMPTNMMSYKALRRDSMNNPKDFDIFEDFEKRNLKVVKKWK